MKLSRKSQNVGQIFIYVLTIVIVGAILVFGYMAIQDFVGRINKVSEVQFRNSVTDQIKKIANQHGTLKQLEFTLSSNPKSVCFISSYGGIPPTLNVPYPLIMDAVKYNTTINVFILNVNKDIVDSFKTTPVIVSNGFKCFEVMNSRITLRIEGMGNYAEIS